MELECEGKEAKKRRRAREGGKQRKGVSEKAKRKLYRHTLLSWSIKNIYFLPDSLLNSGFEQNKMIQMEEQRSGGGGGARKEAEECRVCGADGAGRHYGSVCCSGCKGFFRRSVRFQKLYRCPYGQQCTISKIYRNCCRACRFRKCLRVGLDPKLVQGDWGQTNNARGKMPKMMKTEEDPLEESEPMVMKVKEEPEEGEDAEGAEADGDRMMMRITEESGMIRMVEKKPEEDWMIRMVTNGVRRENFQPGSGMPAGTAPLCWWHDSALNAPSSSRMSLGARSAPTIVPSTGRLLADYLVSIERFCDHFADPSCPDFPSRLPNMNIPLELAFRQPGLIAPRSPIRWTPRHLERGGSVFAKLFSRLLIHQFDWISHLPELAEMSDEDRRILVRRRTMRSTWFTVSQHSLPFGDPRCLQGISVGGDMFYPREPELQAQLDSDIQGLLLDACSMAYDELVVPMRKYRVSEAECALLHALVFFTPVARLSPEGQQLVQTAQNKYLNALTEVVQERCARGGAGDETGSRGDGDGGERPIERMGHLLMLLTATEQIARIGDDTFSMFFAFNMNGMVGQLNYELHMGGGPD